VRAPASPPFTTRITDNPRRSSAITRRAPTTSIQAFGEFATALAEIITRRSETWLCRAWEAVAREPQGAVTSAPRKCCAHTRVADITLAKALASAANEDLIDNILIDEAVVDTARPARRRSTRATTIRDVFGQGLGPSPGFVRATAPRSRFVLVRANAETLTARITLRAAGEVAVFVNGAESARVRARMQWTTVEFAVSLNRGQNVIELRWPAPQPDCAAGVRTGRAPARTRPLPRSADRLRGIARVHGRVMSWLLRNLAGVFRLPRLPFRLTLTSPTLPETFMSTLPMLRFLPFDDAESRGEMMPTRSRFDAPMSAAR
jgi:hypothetical protein